MVIRVGTGGRQCISCTQEAISKTTAAHGRSLDLQILHSNEHLFRRYFGRSLYFNDCPPTQIQKYYGHATLAQTMEYIGINDEMSADAMTKYRPSYLEEVRGRRVA